MKKLAILVAMLFVITLSACENANTNSSQSDYQSEVSNSQPSIPQEEPKTTIKAVEKLEATNQMSIYKNTNYYFKEGVEGYVKILTSARADTNGAIMWDDGQNFCVEVYDGENYFYPIEPTYVQLGTIEAKIYTDMNNNTHNILLDYTTGAGIEISLFVYDGEEKTFTGEVVFKAENINKF